MNMGSSYLFAEKKLTQLLFRFQNILVFTQDRKILKLVRVVSFTLKPQSYTFTQRYETFY